MIEGRQRDHASKQRTQSWVNTQCCFIDGALFQSIMKLGHHSYLNSFWQESMALKASPVSSAMRERKMSVFRDEIHEHVFE